MGLPKATELVAAIDIVRRKTGRAREKPESIKRKGIVEGVGKGVFHRAHQDTPLPYVLPNPPE